MKPGAAYYAGGARVVVDTVPIRLVRKPSAHNLAYLREYERYRVKADSYQYIGGRAEKARNIAKQAKADIQAYADALEISLPRARALIAQHRRHVEQNPLIDLSWEYDL